MDEDEELLMGPDMGFDREYRWSQILMLTLMMGRWAVGIVNDASDR